MASDQREYLFLRQGVQKNFLQIEKIDLSLCRQYLVAINRGFSRDVSRFLSPSSIKILKKSMYRETALERNSSPDSIYKDTEVEIEVAQKYLEEREKHANSKTVSQTQVLLCEFRSMSNQRFYKRVVTQNNRTRSIFLIESHPKNTTASSASTSFCCFALLCLRKERQKRKGEDGRGKMEEG